MQLGHLKTAFAVVWILAAGIAGLMANLTSPLSWAAVMAVALLPPVVVMLRWRAADKSLSESIQEALR